MTVREYVKTRDLTKSLVVKCSNRVLYDSKYNTLPQFIKISERVVVSENIKGTVIELNVKETDNEDN